MNAATKKMILGWLAMHRGDEEGLARWMRGSLRMGIRAARSAITEAKAA